MDHTIVDGVTSYHKVLAADFNPLTYTLKQANGKETILVVDTGDVYEYYAPTNIWYLQP